MDTHSLEVLKEASGHLEYELWMFGECLRWLHVNSKKGKYPQSIQNAVLESFSIHARSLIAFFYKEPMKDDIVAGHFFDDPNEWLRIRPTQVPLLKEVDIEANKRVAHLTYTRTEGGYTWNWTRIYEEMAKVVVCFLDNVQDRENMLDSRLCAWRDEYHQTRNSA